MNNPVVHITTIADSAFFIPTLVMLTSAQANMRAESRYHVHFFHKGLKSYQLSALEQLATPAFRINLQELGSRCWDEFATWGEFPPIVLARLELPNLLPDLDRVLYLDGDIIIHRDLTQLYCTELGDNLLAAVREIALAHSDYPQQSGIPQSINSGVMIMNLARMRDECCVRGFLRTRSEAPASWLYPDQDVLSVCCAGRIHFLPPHCNGMIRHYRDITRPGMEVFNHFFGTAYQNMQELEADFLLTHFAGTRGQRPWETTQSICGPLWEHYFLRSPLRHLELRRNSLPRCNEETVYRLFGLIPLLSVRHKYLPQSDTLKVRVLLFGCLPLLTAQGKAHAATWKLFSLIPLWKRQITQRH